MKKTRKILAIVCALTLTAALAVGGTLAYLTAQSEQVTNTFTIGNITMSLAETTGSSYKIVPGGEQAKDPTVTIMEKSEKCYVYVCVENNVKIGDTVVATPDINSTNWTAVGTNGNKTTYRYNTVVDATSAAQTVPVFTKVTYSNTITEANIQTLTNTTIVLNAYAHQQENVDQATADTAANTHFGTVAPTPAA